MILYHQNKETHCQTMFKLKFSLHKDMKVFTFHCSPCLVSAFLIYMVIKPNNSDIPPLFFTSLLPSKDRSS